MTRLPRTLLALALAVCLPAALPAGAAAATPSYPSITKVSPMTLDVGDTLTLQGKGFRSGKARNTVVFKRDGGRAIFVKAGDATPTKLSVTVPGAMLSALSQNSGKRVGTRFRVRVLAGRFGRRFTSVKSSPVIGPAATAVAPVVGPAAVAAPSAISPAAVAAAPAAPPAAPPAGPPAAGPADDGRVLRDDDDEDGDRLVNVVERQYGLNPLREDTDEDGVGDGFEYYSAKDLNGAALPFPGKRPYPNGLDKSDADIDHDGDGLSLRNEFKAWKFTGSPVPLSYSDGSQYTSGSATLDSDKDVDADGATNYSEVSGPLSGPAYWTAYVTDNRCSLSYVESTYPGPRYQGLDFVDPDSDGDGLLDGADDIDHDGLTNAEEGRQRRDDWCAVYVSEGPGPPHSGGLTPDRFARHDPFNPCKPVYSAACHKFVPLNYYVKTDTYTEDWRGAQP